MTPAQKRAMFAKKWDKASSRKKTNVITKFRGKRFAISSKILEKKFNKFSKDDQKRLQLNF